MRSDKADIEKFANALINLGSATDILPHLEEDLTKALELFEKNPTLNKFLSDPFITDVGKDSALREILSKDIHPVLLHFILILLSERVLHKLHAISEIFFDKVSAAREKVTGQVNTPITLTKTQLEQIEKEVGHKIGKEVSLRVRIDGSILGGFLVRVGDYILDATVDHQLDEIQQALRKS